MLTQINKRMSKELISFRIKCLSEIIGLNDGKSIFIPNEEFDWDKFSDKGVIGDVDMSLFRFFDEYREFKVLHSLFLRGYLYSSFSYAAPIYYFKETIPYMSHLNEMLEMDFITISSQPGHNDDIKDIKNNPLIEYHSSYYGYGFIDGYLHKKYLTNLDWLEDINVLLLKERRELFHGNKEIMKVDDSNIICINVLGDDEKPIDYNDNLWIESEKLNKKDTFKYLHNNVKQYIMENFIHVEFIHPYTGNNGIFDIVLNALKKAQ